nr:hypothetical protein [uncultured bacterium]
MNASFEVVDPTTARSSSATIKSSKVSIIFSCVIPKLLHSHSSDPTNALGVGQTDNAVIIRRHPVSLRRHNPDQVLRVVALAPCAASTSQLPNEAPLGFDP